MKKIDKKIKRYLDRIERDKEMLKLLKHIDKFGTGLMGGRIKRAIARAEEEK